MASHIIYKYNNIVQNLCFFLMILIQSKNDETSKVGVCTLITHVESEDLKRNRYLEVEFCHYFLNFKIK